MRFFNFAPCIFLSTLLLMACSHRTGNDYETRALNTVTIKGLFSGQDHYRQWVIFLSTEKFKTAFYPVKENGTFQLKVPNLKPGHYLFHFGKKGQKNGYSSFQIPVFKQQINLGLIRTDY